MLVAERYRLIEPIGSGGMGEVWRGVDEVLGREVAVKLMRPGRDDVDTEGLSSADRFRLEAQAAAKVNDPHVVTIHDFGSYDGRLFLVMEMVDGRTLSEELATVGVMEPAQAASVVAQAAAGLQAAHDHGIIHRDLKPSNLLVAMDGTVKVADFGIARLVTHPSLTDTAPGEVAGTPHYLAPERAMGEQGGAFTDVYALGCVGYHLVTGRPPFSGEVPAAIAYQHLDAAPVPPHELQPDAGGELEEFLLRMMAKRPEDRPTMGQVAETMAAISYRYESSLVDTAPVTVLPAPRRRLTRPVLVALAAVAGIAAVVLTVRFATADISSPSATQQLAPPATKPAATSTKPPRPTPQPSVRPPVVTKTRTAVVVVRTTSTRPPSRTQTREPLKPPSIRPAKPSKPTETPESKPPKPPKPTKPTAPAKSPKPVKPVEPAEPELP